MSESSATVAPPVPAPPPHNRTGIDYRRPPARKIAVPGGIIDAHCHTREVEFTRVMVEAAAAYGVTEFWTMAPLEHAAALRDAFPGRFHFIAIPGWKRDMPRPGPEFFVDWKHRLESFHGLGSRLIKFHAAPGTCKRWDLSLDDPRIQDIAAHAYSLGYHFMTHVGDPKAWFHGKGTYADGSFGTFDGQFAMLERMLERYPDRIHLGAHMGGSLEKLDALARRLDKYPHYILDSSATKWIARAVAEQSAAAVRDFIIHYQDRILFGSDLVVGDKFDWDHYASRYWVHQMLWETPYQGHSPIEDPDAGQGFDPAEDRFDATRADGIPRLTGIDLPGPVLLKLYRANAERLLPRT